jgi:hypothetical protein
MLRCLLCAPREQPIALLCDVDLQQDYHQLSRCLQAMGRRAFVLTMPRVKLPGSGAGSARRGGWEAYTLPLILERLGMHDSSDESFRLGLRLYLIVGLGPGSQAEFSFELLGRFVQRARRLLDQPVRHSREAGVSRLQSMTTQAGYVSPYRVTSLLLNPRVGAELGALLPEVFL